MKLRAQLLFGLGLVVLACCGCSNSEGDVSTAAPSATTAAGDTQTVSHKGHKLVGAWEGVIEIDENEIIKRLQEQGTGVDPQETIAILKSMTMMIDFHDDGSMHMSATMDTPDGPQTSGGAGQWEIVSDNGRQVTIKSIEEGRDSEQISLDFVDADTFTMQPPGANQNVGIMRFHRTEHVAHSSGESTETR